MSEAAVDNKRIAKNTLFLYLRMVIVMGIGLYTVRAILDLLGVVDYGIYNVIGGVVGMFSFLNGTLATASQRFFSIELAKDDKKSLNQWFCLNITLFLLFILIIIIFAETIGLWFVNNKMIIPEERLFAANVVYQLSIFAFCIQLFSIPYNALIIAYERMSAFAYISIVEAFLKLLIVFVLSVITWDKLIVYGVLMFLVSCGITSSYIFYNIRSFEVSKLHLYWNRQDMKQLMGFSGWHLYGTISVVFRSQAINILINMFFNPAVNAARAIAYQLYTAVSQLSNNFFVAVTPGIYKSYANSEYKSLYLLISRSLIASIFLVSILTIPLYFNLDFVLGLWLKEIPDYTILFAKLVLIIALIDSTQGSTITPALATGRLKTFYLATGTLFILNLPISYVFLSYGFDATITMVVSIVISVIALLIRAYLLIGLIGFPLMNFMRILGKVLLSTIIIAYVTQLSVNYFESDILSLIISVGVSSLLHFLLYLFYIFDKRERNLIINMLISKFSHGR